MELNLFLQSPLELDIPAEYVNDDTNIDDSFTFSGQPYEYIPPRFFGVGCNLTTVVDAYFLSLYFLDILADQDPSKFYVFLTSNVVIQGPFGFFAGYHDAPDGGPLTYTYSTYFLSPALRPSNEDLAVLSHEIGGWLTNPFTPSPNFVHPWGYIGLPTCQNNLEVGDPFFEVLEYTDEGVTWKFQELAFTDFFFGNPLETPLGAGGVYSQNGYFQSAAMQCGGTYPTDEL